MEAGTTPRHWTQGTCASSVGMWTSLTKRRAGSIEASSRLSQMSMTLATNTLEKKKPHQGSLRIQ